MMVRLVAPLFVPGNKPGLFSKATASGADAIIYDIEDAVSHKDKDLARKAIVARARAPAYEIVRVNSSASGLLDDDLQAIRNNPPCAIMLAKAETGDDLRKIGGVLGLQIELIPLIETARGLSHLPEILLEGNVPFAAFGSIDFALDIGSRHDRMALLLARCELVFRSRLAGRGAPIDGVTTAIDDLGLVEDDALHARSLGFGGKLAIHPRQIAPIIASFSVTDEEVVWANRVLGSVQDGGAQKLDGQMVDRPVIDRARSILASARSGSNRDIDCSPDAASTEERGRTT